MKICFLVYNIFGIGGTVRTVVNTANYFVDQNFDVEIISVRKTLSKPSFIINSKVKITPLYDTKRGVRGKGFKRVLKEIANRLPSIVIDRTEELYKMFTLYTDIRILKKLKNLEADILITTIPSFNILAVKFAKRVRIKIGQEHAQFDVHKKSLQMKIIRNYPQLDALTTLTERELNVYQRIFGDKIRIFEVPNATSSTTLRADYSSKVIITAGRFVYQKGFERLIELYKPLAETYSDWELRIYGSGSDYDLMRKTIEDNRLYNNVFIYPNSNKILNEFQKASIFVLPSRFEPFGMVVIEAMSVGLPVVSYDSYGPTKILTDGVDGFIVPMDDAKCLIDRLSALMSDQDLREQMGSKALERSGYYSEDNVGQLWLAIFGQLL